MVFAKIKATLEAQNCGIRSLAAVQAIEPIAERAKKGTKRKRSTKTAVETQDGVDSAAASTEESATKMARKKKGKQAVK
jgi:hypothetical protein